MIIQSGMGTRNTATDFSMMKSLDSPSTCGSSIIVGRISMSKSVFFVYKLCVILAALTRLTTLSRISRQVSSHLVVLSPP